MNITLNGIKITQDSKTLAFEKNNNVDEIVITVDTDESWSYKLDVKYPDKFNIGKDAPYNIIDLDRNGNICSVILTSGMLPFNGKYTMQLRGISGDKVYHSDTFEVWVKYSIEPGSTYNPVPSEFYQVEARLDDKVDEAKQYAENAEIASTRMPKISPDNTWLIWDAETGDYVDTGIVASGGTTDHSKLINRSTADQHPMSAITGLEKALESKQPAGAYLTDKDLDTTLKETGKAADAAEVGKRLSSLSEEIDTTSESKVSAHNTGADTHSDIRLLIQGLTDRLNALADSDDTTLDQLSEIVAYIKSNKNLIDAITTSKVNVADIVDNLTTNVANKPLSAAQGVALKALIDAITVPDKLPNPNALTFTGAVTGSYDGSAPLSVKIPSGGTDISLGLTSAAVGQIIKIKAVDDSGKPTAWEAVDMPSGGGSNWVKVYDMSNTIAEEISAFEVDLTKSDHMKEFQLWLKLDQNTAEDWGAAKNINVSVNGETIGYFIFSARLNTNTELYVERSLEAMTVTKRCISVVGLNYNTTQPFWMVDQRVRLQNNGKLSIHFPAPYAGKITAKVYGRY